MGTHISLENFEEIYNQSYKYVLKFILQKCSNIDDVNDLVQNTYLNLFEYLHKKETIELEDYQSYLIAIAKKQLAKHYGLLYKIQEYFILKTENEEYSELVEEIDSKIEIEKEIVLKLDAEEVWKNIKQKDIKTIKIFYLYFHEELKITEFSKLLDLKESNVKNVLYRTLKEIRKIVDKEGDFYEQ